MVRDQILELAALQVDQQLYDVSLQTWHDGTGFAGRLWFDGPGTERGGIPGRRLFSGASRDELIDRVQEVSVEEMTGQFRHAMIDRRRYLPLRRLINDLLHNVRLYNQVAIDIRMGTKESEPGEAELLVVQKQMLELVGGMRKVAGMEDLPAE
ncbi:MAG: hypothetical protein ACR2G6_04690 [Gemmatimonadaceae bacterium]